jgi:hypothetical protein
MGTYAVQLCGEVLDAAEYPPPVDKSTFAAAMSDSLQRMQAHAPACRLPAQEFSQLSPVLRVPAVGSNAETVRLGSKRGSKTGGQAGDLPMLRDRLAWSRAELPGGHTADPWDTGAQRGGLPGQAMRRLPAART